jgi:hypothetical protein
VPLADEAQRDEVESLVLSVHHARDVLDDPIDRARRDLCI